MPLAAGRTLSHYCLVEQIGEGGMGVVWKATDTTLDRDVAIKVLPEAFSRDPERMARFEREAKILGLLAYGSSETGKQMSYVVEIRPDGSLGSPIELPTTGSVGHLWSADGKTLFVEDERHRLMKIARDTHAGARRVAAGGDLRLRQARRGDVDRAA